MRLVLGPPDVESGGHSYCCDFGESFKYYDKALILPDFLLMKAIQEIETSSVSNWRGGSHSGILLYTCLNR